MPPIVEPVDDNIFVLNSTFVRSRADLGLTATFTCTVNSQPTATIEWSYDLNVSVSIQTVTLRQVSTLTIPSVDIGDQGEFTCRATSPYGSVTSTANLGVFGKLDSLKMINFF